MASGSSARRQMIQQEQTQPPTFVPQRATRQLPELTETEVEEIDQEEEPGPKITRNLPFLQPKEKITAVLHTNQIVVNEFPQHPLEKHRPWLNIFLISICVAVVFIGILTWSAIGQRPDGPRMIDIFGGQSYSIQVGGDKFVNTWQGAQPEPSKVVIPIKSGPYSVLGTPSISVAFINKVLAQYNSPAAGKGQALYDLGIKYGIDPAFALAFFMHESTFGTRGEATKTMSLGNLRCISSRPCADQNIGGGYAQMKSWEDGFEVWYKLIRNLYVAEWGLTTVDQIIPRYAPSADNNNEAAYIGSLKQAINTWHAGVITVQ